MDVETRESVEKRLKALGIRSSPEQKYAFKQLQTIKKEGKSPN